MSGYLCTATDGTRMDSSQRNVLGGYDYFAPNGARCRYSRPSAVGGHDYFSADGTAWFQPSNLIKGVTLSVGKKERDAMDLAGQTQVHGAAEESILHNIGSLSGVPRRGIH